MCCCYYCKNRKDSKCGRFPDFLNQEDSNTAGIIWDKELYVDCNNCEDECHTILCAEFEEDSNGKRR